MLPSASIDNESTQEQQLCAAGFLAIGLIPGTDLIRVGQKADDLLDASKTLNNLDAVDEITDLGKRIDRPGIRYKPQHWDDAEKALDNVVHDAYTKRPGREKLDNLLNQGKNAPNKGSRFDLDVPKGTMNQMLAAVKRLDHLESVKGVTLSADEIAGLTENARRVAKKYWELKGTGRTAQSVQNQLDRPRWRFLDQAPEAKAILDEVIKDFGG